MIYLDYYLCVRVFFGGEGGVGGGVWVCVWGCGGVLFVCLFVFICSFAAFLKFHFPFQINHCSYFEGHQFSVQ